MVIMTGPTFYPVFIYSFLQRQSDVPSLIVNGLVFTHTVYSGRLNVGTWLVVTPLYTQTPSRASEGYFHTTHKSNISVDTTVMRSYYAGISFYHPQNRPLGF